MSDPVTNVEIEDVLSSIRRLVSEDARVRPVGWPADPAASAATPEAEGAAPEVGRLVLTPALRVSEETPPAESAEAVADDASGQEDGMTDAAADADGHPQHEAWDDAQDERFSEAQTHEPEPVIDPLVLSADEAQPADEGHEPVAAPYVLEAGDDAGVVWEDHHDADHQDMDHDDAERHDSDMARNDMAETTDDAAAETFHEDAEDVVASVMEEAAMPEDAAFVFATSRDGAARETVSAVSDDSLSDDDLLDDRAFLLREDEAILDEETLREMVAEIVRQELQGALGERITRNVRKLVRREIHRALTSHELE